MLGFNSDYRALSVVCSAVVGYTDRYCDWKWAEAE